MTHGRPHPPVVIAGAGVAASALACLLRDDGYGVVLLIRRRRATDRAGSPTIEARPVIEALPEATVRLLADAGLAGALDAAGAVTVRGFDNAYGPGARRLDGVWTHVDRGQLARECLLAARRRGAMALPAAAIAPPVVLPGGDVEVRAGQAHLAAVAAVDATGRAARWSRPVARCGSDRATLYTGPGRPGARPGRVVRIPDGWAYRIEHPQASVVGVVRPRDAAAAALDGAVARDLDLTDPEPFVRAGVRPAAVQWSRRPVGFGRLAIGDAALALSPLAGQGLRFAVSSALAAAAVLRTWRDGDGELASDYYRRFVDGVRSRHLAKLAVLAGGQPSGADDPAESLIDRGQRLRWSARVERAAVNRGGRIVADECVVLPDGGLVRWVGGVDLLLLRDAVADGRTAHEICTELAPRGIGGGSARALVAWARHVGALEYQ